MSIATMIVTILFMLLLSAFFSGMEIAFLSKNRLKLEIDRKQSPMFDNIADIFARHPAQYITTILVGNNIALVVYSLLMSRLIQCAMEALFGGGVTKSLLLESVLSTLVIIFVAEFLPKSIFRSNPNFYYKLFAPIIYLFYLLLYPLAALTMLLSKGLLRAIGRKGEGDSVALGFDRQDLVGLVEGGGAEVQADSDNEIRLFQNALDFADLRVRDSMTPRVDVEAVDIDHATIEEVTAKFEETKYSRLFVWRNSADNIIGYINSKSLFRSPRSVEDMLMDVMLVPESMPLNALLQSLTKHKSNIAVVIDEFGCTAGVISLEDVLEQIFGEIEDEHDEPEMIANQIATGVYELSSRHDVSYLNDHFNLGIEEDEEYDTLGGYIIYKHKGIPEEGEKLIIGEFEIDILHTIQSRIELVRVKKIGEK